MSDATGGSAELRVLPMFPLGNVLFPYAVLPLHVFEERYRALVRRCLDTDLTFGVVLIERGPEVGGGEVRTDVGTAARIFEAGELPDGRWAVVAAGEARFRVERWLPDDPFPLAEVSMVDEPPVPAGLGGLRRTVERAVRRGLALQAELGEAAAPVTVELSPDDAVAIHQLGAIAPIGPADKQQVLRIGPPDERLAALASLVADAVELLEFRLGAPG